MTTRDAPVDELADLRAAIDAHWLAEERPLCRQLAAQLGLDQATRRHIVDVAADWVGRLRRERGAKTPLDAFLHEYDLGSEEGVLLMCLAEALLRIPDPATADRLIADTLGAAAWRRHLGHSDSLLVNASTWGLLLTGSLVHLARDTHRDVFGALAGLVGRLGEPLVRSALRQGMELMAGQFVLGPDIGAALERAAGQPQWRHSYDMLGEAALTAADARQYAQAYLDAIRAVGAAAGRAPASVHRRPGISIKLSALHPRCEPLQPARLHTELLPVLRRLAGAARDHGLGLTLDAEEADRLDPGLAMFESLRRDPALHDWEGLGLAVQAVQKRAAAVIDWLRGLARQTGMRIPVRLVKGAYWDTEIKRAQEQGLADYPVFTHKSRTDLAFLACARRLLDARDAFYPMLATHNAHTLAAVAVMAGDARGAEPEPGFELQRLHGMGEALHRMAGDRFGLPCRVYAPVGAHADLLPYLVRRLLENGANTSFVNRIHDARLPPRQVASDPIDTALGDVSTVPPPPALFLPRRNAAGFNLAASDELRRLQRAIAADPDDTGVRESICVPTPARSQAQAHAVRAPADRRRVLGSWRRLDAAALPAITAAAATAQAEWERRGAEARAAILEAAGDRLEAAPEPFLHLLVNEAGKTLADAVGEWRETIDALRYYAGEARRLMAAPQVLPGVTGEANRLRLAARGVFACIAPWNFPLAIFTGQVAAALAAGNAVVAKPAAQTPLVAHRVTGLLHAAGVPHAVLQCVLGDGEMGAQLVADPGIDGVAFTGSLSTARRVARHLAAREGPILPLIAETGGQNVMIADSSALPEQIVRDALRSAFGGAGQRCSALRLLFLQQDIADAVIARLRGAMQELAVGDPRHLATDVGPVIDTDARRRLEQWLDELRRRGDLLEQCPLPAACAHGDFVAPSLARVERLADLGEEHFGPVLHVARWRAGSLDAVLEQVHAAGYGLTLGVQTRIESTWRHVAQAARVGNVYVNRAMTGAVIGCQPFGGEGLSGTGPKAGGPHTLLRYTVERAVSVNTAAIGGNAELFGARGSGA